MSSAITDGIRISVSSTYLARESEPGVQYIFPYEVTISNEGDAPATLQTRHWVITDARGTIEEVKGPGVVGETPRLEPGQSHTYQSFCVLRTPRGTMHGSYQMVRDDGTPFDADIAPFVLSVPGAEADRVLN